MNKANFPPLPNTSIWSTIFQWVVLAGITFGIWFMSNKWHFIAPRLHWWQVIGLALSLAFTWVEVLKWGSIKPFNCIKCLTGWFSLILGCWCFGSLGIVLMPVGLFVGAVFEVVKMRYL